MKDTEDEPEQIWYWDDVAVAVAALTGTEHKPLFGMDYVVPYNDDINLKADLNSDPYLYCSLLSRVSPMSSVTVTP